MDPMEHLAWAQSLPDFSEAQCLPPFLQSATESVANMSPEELNWFRFAAKVHWRERKRVLDQAWPKMLATLPEHIRSVLGPKKNLLLFSEMAAAAGSPDRSLTTHLAYGFPMTGP